MPSDGFTAAIFDVDGVLVDSPHERAWKDSLRELMDGEWADIRPETTWTDEAFTAQVYQSQMSGKPRLAGATAALEYFGIPDPAARALTYAARKQVMVVTLIEAGLFRAYPDALRFVLAVKAAGLRIAAASSSKNAGLFLRQIRLDTFAEGGMLSLRPDIVGDEVARELEQLQAQVPPDPPGVAHATVESELGGPTGSMFAVFEVEPFASGSVAQVHRARLHDGTRVVVKVLHDGAADRVLGDLEVMAAVASSLESADPRTAQLRPGLIAADFSQMMQAAIDLRQERENLQRFGANFADEPDVVIPTPYPELSTGVVLTMSEIQGAPFTDRAAVAATGWDVDTLVQRAVDVYLEMIFRDGIYHADPHPGNLTIPDGTHLSILDFGDVGRVSSGRREQLAALVAAIAARDVDGLTDAVIELTSPPPGTDLDALRSDLEAWLQRYLLAGVAELDMAGISATGVQVLQAHHLVVPADLSRLSRVLNELQGLGRHLGVQAPLTELLKPYVSRMTRQRFDPARLLRQVGRRARGWDRFATALPGDLQSVLERLSRNELGIDVRVHDQDGAVDRLVDGLLASACVLGSAELITRRTGPVVRGVSVPGLLAAGIGAVTWQRLAAARREHESFLTRTLRVVRHRPPDHPAATARGPR